MEHAFHDETLPLSELELIMKTLLISLFTIVSGLCYAQGRTNPLIKTAGGIFEVPDAVEKPDPSIQYKIVIELFTASDNPKEINQALNTVARLVNLHVMGRSSHRKPRYSGGHSW